MTHLNVPVKHLVNLVTMQLPKDNSSNPFYYDRQATAPFSVPKRCAFVITDVSDVSPNVFYELGFAQGFGKQVVVTARKGTALPFDISDVPVIFWDGQENLKEQLRKRIGVIAARLGR